MFRNVEVTRAIAKLAGEALAWLGSDVDAGLTVDAIVMATASRHGPLLYTSDPDDMLRFQPYFPSVRIFSASDGNPR